MATQTKTILPVALRTDFSITSPTVDVPADLLSATIRMISTDFTDPADTCALSINESFDNGATWRFVTGWPPTPGGIDRFGNPRLPGIRVNFTNEQRAAAKFQVVLLTVGTWTYGFALDLET